MTVYLSFRFQFKFAFAASVALIHDLFLHFMVIGVFQIKTKCSNHCSPVNTLWILYQRYNCDLLIELRKFKLKSQSIDRTMINVSINQTLGRTINTSFTTLISLLHFIIGGAVELYDFAFVLTFGIIIGTYSSIFIASQ